MSSARISDRASLIRASLIRASLDDPPPTHIKRALPRLRLRHSFFRWLSRPTHALFPTTRPRYSITISLAVIFLVIKTLSYLGITNFSD